MTHRQNQRRWLGWIGAFILTVIAVRASGEVDRPGVAVSGVVVVAGPISVPPDTTVRLKDLQSLSVIEVAADATGRFRFDHVLAGRFSIVASSPGYMGLPHGARYDRSLEVVVAVDDRDVTGLTLQLAKPSSLSGFVRDRFGSGMSSVRVLARRWIVTSGVRTLSDERASARTDDFGRYQIADLAPGRYVVSVAPALARSTVPGEVYLETFYPSAINPTEAGFLEVPPGADVGGVDINVPLIRTYSLSGRLAAPPGASIARAIVWAVAKGRENVETPVVGRIDGDTLAFPSLRQGTYTVEARGVVRGVASQSLWTHWARLDVTISGSDVRDIDLTWAPTLSVEFSIGFKAVEARRLPKVASVHLMYSGQLVFRDVPTGAVDQAGKLVISGVAPGDYWVRADVPNGWTLQSIHDAIGNDLTYQPISVRADGGTVRIRAVYAFGLARLEGRLLTASGQPTSERALAIFPEVLDSLSAPWPNVHVTRPDTQGKFTFPDLAEGPYLLTTFEDRVEDAWKDPAFLRELAPTATKITVPPVGVVVRDVRLPDREPKAGR